MRGTDVTDESPIVIDEYAVDFDFDGDVADTILEIIEPLHPIVMRGARATTASEWPPSPPPPPAELDEILAVGTQRPARRARVYAAVRRPTTSGDVT